MVRRLVTILILVLIIAAAIYYRDQLLVLWQDIERVRNQPEVEKILAETRREEYGIFCSGVEIANDCYLFDKNGVVFAKARTVVGEVILRIDEITDSRPPIGQSFLPQSDWENTLKILEFVKKGEWPAATFRLKRQQQELILEGLPKLLFSLRFDPSQHLLALTELKNKVNFQSLLYLDLRVEDKIFYK